MSADDVAALRAEVEALRARVASLEIELAGWRRAPSMAQSGCCPACGGGKLLRAAQVDDSNRAALGFHRPSMWSTRVEGKLSAFVCATCGVIEWYATVDDLKPGGTVHAVAPREVPPAPDGGPYR